MTWRQDHQLSSAKIDQSRIQKLCVWILRMQYETTQWLSSNLSWFASLNNKAFGNYSVIHKSFHTSSESSDSNNRGCQPFFKLNNSIYQKKLRLDVKFLVNAIAEFEKWLTTSIIRLGEVWKLFCGLQNKLQKLCYSLRKIWTNPMSLPTLYFDWYQIGRYGEVFRKPIWDAPPINTSLVNLFTLLPRG